MMNLNDSEMALLEHYKEMHENAVNKSMWADRPSVIKRWDGEIEYYMNLILTLTKGK